jgi:glycosyltransferase involved in cell wall biosynthesis
LPGLVGWFRAIYEHLFSEKARAKLRPTERIKYIQRQLKRSPTDTVVQAFADLRPMLPDVVQTLEKFDDDAIFVAVMEDATLYMWLSQVFRKRPYIPMTVIAESHYLKQYYPETQRRAVEEWMFANACRHSHRVVCQTEASKADMVEYFGVNPDHVVVIRSPTNCALIREKAKAPVEVDLPDRKTIFVHVERLMPEKNHDLLIEACALLREQDNDFAVLCYGEGDLRDEIGAKIKARGLEEHIFLKGHAANPYPVIAAARAVLQTSHIEGLPIILLDALALGTPILATDCPTGPREILDGGRYGMLLPVDDAPAFAAAMQQIIVDDTIYERFKLRGPERATYYDISNVALEWEMLLSA